MRTPPRFFRSLLALLPILLLPVLSAQEAADVERTYAIRSGGRIVGYQIETETHERDGDRPVIRFATRSLMKLEVLGQQFDQQTEQTWILDAADRRTLRLESKLTAGPQVVEAAGVLAEDGFRLDGDEDVLDPTVVVISPEFRWIPERCPQRVGGSATVEYLMPEIGGAGPAQVTLIGERQVTVRGEPRTASEYELHLTELGTVMRLFLDAEQIVVRCEIPEAQLEIDLAEPSIVERIERFDFTSGILAKTNLDLDDPSVLTFVELRAVIQATPDVTAASLNGPGQRFLGTVEDGRIEGVFTIAPPRSDGTGAPPFPFAADTFAAAALQPYLQPESNIESDDPAIVEKARELADGAASCFEVVDRLARWTEENIPYAIPGGGSAARTFALRQGECGGHSRVLAAMLRSLGIPARTPMGGMYVPLYGGAFGQHMWTEAWLGDAIGWLPVDCTAGQSTFIDAGHIRLSDAVTIFAPKSIEVLDYAPKAAAVAPSTRRTDAYPWPIGEAQRFVYSAAGQELGTERMTYRGRDERGHVFDSELELVGGSYRETTETVVGDDGRLLSFHAERHAGGDTTFDIGVAGGTATLATVGPDGERRDDVEVDPAILVLHNNNTAHFAIALQRALPASEGEPVRLRMLHTEQRSPLGVALTRQGMEEIAVGDRAVPATVVAVTLAGLTITLHADDQGRLLRFHQAQGDVTIALQ